jgi:hypothetical protein
LHIIHNRHGRQWEGGEGADHACTTPDFLKKYENWKKNKIYRMIIPKIEII